MKRRERQAGISLMEVTVAVAVITVGLVGLVFTITHATRSNSVSRENEAAMRAAEQIIEEMMSVPFTDIFEEYDGEGTEPMVGVVDPSSGTVELGAENETGDMIGQVIFPINEDGDQLDEATTSEVFGLAADLDLDGDGSTDGIVAPGDYQILPVAVVISWTGIDGARTLRFQNILTDR